MRALEKEIDALKSNSSDQVKQLEKLLEETRKNAEEDLERLRSEHEA